jgi:hypothetical protein
LIMKNMGSSQMIRNRIIAPAPMLSSAVSIIYPQRLYHTHHALMRFDDQGSLLIEIITGSL